MCKTFETKQNKQYENFRMVGYNCEANCTRNACTTWALISVIIRHGFGVPEVVLTILHFGDTVAELILVKIVLLLFERKIHEVTPTHFFDITAFFISYLLNG